MTRDERETIFKGGLKKLQNETGIGLQATHSFEILNPGKSMLSIGIVLVEIDGWQPPDESPEESE